MFYSNSEEKQNTDVLIENFNKLNNQKLSNISMSEDDISISDDGLISELLNNSEDGIVITSKKKNCNIATSQEKSLLNSNQSNNSNSLLTPETTATLSPKTSEISERDKSKNSKSSKESKEIRNENKKRSGSNENTNSITSTKDGEYPGKYEGLEYSFLIIIIF